MALQNQIQFNHIVPSKHAKYQRSSVGDETGFTIGVYYESKMSRVVIKLNFGSIELSGPL